MKIEEEKKELQTKVERLEKELGKNSFYLKQEKEKNEKIISDLTKKVEEDVDKEKGMFMEIEGLVDELVRGEKDIKILTQQRDSLDVNLNQVQQEVVNLRHTIETLTRDKAELEDAKMLAVNVVVGCKNASCKCRRRMQKC